MKHYKDINNEVFAYETDGSQDHLIGDKVLMTADEVELHINPPKTEEQIMNSKILEAKAYLEATDFKMTVDYYATLAEVEQLELTTKRQEAREYIRMNEVA
jgi:hypothetical protein